MNNWTLSRFQEWKTSNALIHDPKEERFSLDEPEFSFRVPIGDYLLQLDYRIRACLELLPSGSNLLIFRKQLVWDTEDSQKKPLQAILRALGVTSSAAALQLMPDERQVAFTIAYLTNRWGAYKESVYITSETSPELLLYICGSPESLFVVAPSKVSHDRFATILAKQRIPAYGPNIDSPMRLPEYEDFLVGNSMVEVDRQTGKIVGPGSDESVLLPEYLPPE